MKNALKFFFQVLRAYTIEEKVISIVIFSVVFFLSVQSGMDLVKGGGGVGNMGYVEGVISDKPIILNPLFVDFNEVNRDLSQLIFSGLVKYDPEKKEFVSDMAYFSLDESKTVYTFVLKNNFWHDGYPVTADDVYFTFHDVIQNPAFQNPILVANFKGVEITKINNYALQFKLQRPNSFFITNMNLGILPKHLFADVPPDQILNNPLNLKPVGSGPYQLLEPVETFEDGKKRIDLVLYQNYQGPLPKISQIRYNVYPNSEMLLKEKNALDVISKVSPDILENVKEGNHFEFQSYELPQYTAIFFNMERPIIKNDKVRLALLKSVDKNELLKLLPDKLPVDTPLLQLNQSEWIYKSNLKEAQGALFDSGYKFDKEKNDGIRKDSKGNNLKLILLARAYETGSPLAEENEKVIEFLKKTWKELGVELEVQRVTSEEFNQKIVARDYDMVLAGQSLGYNLDTYSYWHSSQASPEGLNLSNYKRFDADYFIEKLRTTFDVHERDKVLNELAKTFADDVPAIFLYRPKYTFAVSKKMKGITLKNVAFISDRFAGVAGWCIDCN